MTASLQGTWTVVSGMPPVRSVFIPGFTVENVVAQARKLLG